ncbi:MAG: amylo-alpha-1,6-glucosidase [Chloroflexi bacterium]|nr:amylo-alpha-1,6-glucosidase [Chloroflexota bacterium]MDA8187910.1 glycogen debranching enzyme N-terminal domain-containing protein [Dehalococcoidales bacterium]
MIVLGREYLNSLESALSREWLVTNGIGGYASSTIFCANTRRYHGLLMAALQHPLRRTLLLYALDEELEIGNSVYALNTSEFADGTVSPCGYEYLEEFRLEGTIPFFSFSFPGTTMEKAVWMEHGKNTTYVRYTLGESSPTAVLRIKPLVSFRDHHSELRGSHDAHFQVTELSDGCEVVAPSDGVPLRIVLSPKGAFTHTGNWYWRFMHRREMERGLECNEDAYSPGVFTVGLEPGDSVTLMATVEDIDTARAGMGDCLGRQKRRREELVARSEASDRFARQLVFAADHFIATRPAADSGDGSGAVDEMATVIAGYHWFGDWSRDAFVGLPGLLLSTGRFAEARSLLCGFATYASQGMIPNFFPEDTAPPVFNSVDAALWFFYAVDRYLQRTDDLGLVEELYPVLEDIVDWHVRGTRHNIKADPVDGLLYAGEDGIQLTWMDAKVDDWVITPRRGKPVEVNALWYNALASMGTFARRLGKPTPASTDIVQKVWSSFNEKFWNSQGDYLYDVVDCRLGQDASFRPNQILAISLPYPVLRRDRWKVVVDKVMERLVTPFGLRTLPSDDPLYVGSYLGDQRHRDGAYHQGTVWPWLIGSFVDAHLKVYGDKASARRLLCAFESHVRSAGVGFISEIFDGDWPHAPQGCIAQAWSVAEVLRAWLMTE